MERAAHTLEDGFGHVVVVFAANAMDVERDSAMRAECAEELTDALGAQFADLFAAKRTIEGEHAPTAEVDRDEDQGFVHGRVNTRIPLDRFAVHRFAQRAAQHDAHILDRVVIIDVKVALDGEAKVELPMKGQLLEKMVEEAHLGRDIASGAAIQVEDRVDGGLRRLSIDFGIPDRRGVLRHSVHCGTAFAGYRSGHDGHQPMKRIFAFATLLSITTLATATEFADSFNRADSPTLTGNWDVIAGDIAIENGEAAGRPFSPGLALAQAAGNVHGMRFQMDVRAVANGTFSYAALAIGTGGTAPGQGLFVKVQDNNGDGLFDTYGFYTGNNQASGFSGAMFGVLDNPISRARVTAYVDGDVVRLGIDSDFDGFSNATTSANGVGELALSDRFGFGISGGAYADNYSATAVPEPATLAAIGVGLAALRRRRRN